MNEKLPKHISYSSYSTWLECGWKYYLTKLDDIQEKHAVWFTGGSAVHKATELWDKHGGEAETVWNNVWFQQVKDDEEANGDMSTWQFTKREDVSWWYGEGLWMLDRWIKFREGGWEVYEDFIEKEYEITINDTVVRLAIDRVMVDFDGNRTLVDIKTGATSQKHPLQLAVYAWALQKQGISIDKAGFWDARNGTISTWNIEHLHPERIEDMFLTFDKARKTDIFLPNFNNCGRCGVLSYCKWMNGQYTQGLEQTHTIGKGKENG